MHSSTRQIPKLELALLRRGLEQSTSSSDRCACCRRTPLIGERIYSLQSGVVVCELCRKRRRDAAGESRIVHTPAFGHTIRIIDQRGVAQEWANDADGQDWAA